MLKLTLLYGHRLDSAAFEKYYAETHIPPAVQIPHVDHEELTFFTEAVTTKKPAYCRMNELYFTDKDALNNAMISVEGKRL